MRGTPLSDARTFFTCRALYSGRIAVDPMARHKARAMPCATHRPKRLAAYGFAQRMHCRGARASRRVSMQAGTAMVRRSTDDVRTREHRPRSSRRILYQPVRPFSHWNEAHSRRSGAACVERAQAQCGERDPVLVSRNGPLIASRKPLRATALAASRSKRARTKASPSCSDTSGRYWRLPRRCAPHTHIRTYADR